MARDYYKILGISRSADKAEVKKAYRRLARKYHPDVNPGDQASADRFKEIQEAYAVLSDEKKRKQYDTYGRVDFDPSQADFDPFHRAQRGGAWRQAGNVRFDFGAPGGEGGFQDLGDIFGEIFGGAGGRSQRRAAPAKGADHESSAEIDFVDAVRGTTITLPVQRQVSCADCGGSGRGGQGNCAVCHGVGGVVTTDRIRVKVAEGIADGARVRVSGKGAEGRSGGQAGDLYVRIRVREHPFFRREGDDIHTTIPVTFTEAYRGTEVEVGTIHGPVRAKIPQGTDSGTTFRLRGKGVRNVKTRAHGDHLYTVRIVVPKVFSHAGQEAARRVSELYSDDPRKGLPRKLE